MSKIVFLGDSHGDFQIINEISLKHQNDLIIHLGDVGLGFKGVYLNTNSGLWEACDENIEFSKNLKFIRGNHDAPSVCHNHPNYLGDYGYIESLKLFFVSGAYSIDKEYRKEGVDWWEEEQLTYHELNDAADSYERVKPEIMVSHTCPNVVADILALDRERYRSRTEDALEAMFNRHKPKYWIFGHWHKSWRKNILGTEFVCCGINEAVTLDI